MLRLLVLGLILMTAGARAQPAQGPGPGVSLQLAEQRAARITDLKYEVHFTVPATQSDPVTGRVTVRFGLKDATRPLALDFAAPEDAVSAGVLNGRQGKPRHEIDHLVIAPADPASPNMSAATFLPTPWRSSSVTSPMKTWSAT